MGKQNNSLPFIQIVAFDDKGNVTERQEGHFGHNALWRRQNEMLSGVNASHVMIYRPPWKGKEGKE